MKKVFLLLFSCVCIGIHADEFTLTSQAPSTVIVGKRFTVTYSSNAKQCHGFSFDGINNTLPNDLGGLRVVASPAYSDVRSLSSATGGHFSLTKKEHTPFPLHP